MTTEQITQYPPHVQATINRAVAKAYEQARLGNLPALLSSRVDDAGTHQTWAVTSRTIAGTVYLVDVLADANGVDTHCQCEAQHASRICWHRSAARMALFGDIKHHDCRGWEHAGSEDLASLMTYWRPADPFDAADWTAA